MSFCVSFLILHALGNVFVLCSGLSLQNLLTTSWPSLSDGFGCTNRTRKEIRDLSYVELERFKTTMQKLVFARDEPHDFFPPPSFWDTLVAAHIAHLDEAHDGAYFLPWHRLFLLTVEDEVRRTIDENFTMPYWNWTVDAHDPARSSIFSDSLIGSSEPSTPLVDGPFRGLTSIYPRPRPVLRGFNSSVHGDICRRRNVRFSSGTDISSMLAQKNWSTFADMLEEAHDVVHVGLGGMLDSFEYSPNDPLFYLIHTFVDKVWTDRQLRSGQPYEFGGKHRLGGAFVEAKRSYVLSLFGRSVNYALGTTCVQYV